MTRPEDDEADPALQQAAALLKDLPTERPSGSFSKAVVEQARPVATRRRHLMLGLVLAALVAVVVYAAVMLWTLSEVPS